MVRDHEDGVSNPLAPTTSGYNKQLMERETSWYKAGGVVHNFVIERPMTFLLCSESFPRMDWEFVRNKSIHTVVSSKYKPSLLSVVEQIVEARAQWLVLLRFKDEIARELVQRGK